MYICTAVFYKDVYIKKLVQMSKKLTKEEFISRANEIHNNQYDYSKVDYINTNTKVCIICSKHGEFWQTPKNHLKGCGCCKCGHERTNNSKILTTEEFIRRARIKHGDKYNYDKTVYKSFKDDIIVTCPQHGDFLVNPHCHLSNGTMCPVCAKLAKGPNRLSTSEFIIKAKQVHGNFYNYDKVNYVLSSEKVTITCPIHGDFEMTPNKHLMGENCPKCVASKGERFVNKCLSILNVNFESEYILKFENILRNHFRIDFAVYVNKKIYLIEYNGIQHYQASDYFGGEEKFKEQLQRDNILRDFVLKNSDKYELLEIDYRYNKYTIITKILKFLKVPINSDINSKLGELLESCDANQQPSLELTIKEGSETNTWNCNTEYNSDTSTQHLETDDDIVRAEVNKETSEIIV